MSTGLGPDSKDHTNLFQKGQSGNPGGRRPSLAKAIQRRYGKSGQKLLPALHRLAFAVLDDGQPDPTVSARDRINAIKLLLEWGWSKPATHTVDDTPIQPQPLVVQLTDGLSSTSDPEPTVPQ